MPIDNLLENLRELCLFGLRRRYADDPTRCHDGKFSSDVLERLEWELFHVQRLEIAAFFLLLADIVQFASEHGIGLTARGIASSSLICYALGISHVCPLEHGLIFERFCGENSSIKPDIDLLLDLKRINEILDYLEYKYSGNGATSTAGPNFEYISARKDYFYEFEYVGTQWRTTDSQSTNDFEQRFYDLKALTILADMVDRIKQSRGITVEPYGFPTDDPETFALLGSADTKGIFQLDVVTNDPNEMQSYILGLLRQVKPDHFEDIMAILALNRPRPLFIGMDRDYVKGKHGRQTPKYLHPIVEDVLSETYGVMIYQEQGMQVLHRVGMISLSDSYNCIKAIAIKKSGLTEQFRSDFISGAKKNGLTKKLALEIFKEVERFTPYTYNKAHIANYAQMTYMMAYIKAHYPVEFMAAVSST